MVDYQFLKFITGFCIEKEIKENALALLDFLDKNKLFQGFNVEIEVLEQEVIFYIESLEILVSYDFSLFLYKGESIDKVLHTENIEEIQEELLNININF